MTPVRGLPVIVTLVVLGGAAAAGAAPTGGKVLYERYCASCHGLEGRGDGPVAAVVQPPPTDLTRLESGEPEIMKQIDGRRSIRAHGTSAMPVWGEVFEQSLITEPHTRRTTLQRVLAITDHVLRLRKRTSGAPPTP